MFVELPIVRQSLLIGTIISAAVLGGTLSSVVKSFDNSLPTESSDFSCRSLLGKPDNEIGQYAIDLVRARGMVVQGSKLEVALIRPFRRDDFETIGLPYVSIPDPEPPLRMVILRGEFDLSQQPGGRGLTPTVKSFSDGYRASGRDPCSFGRIG